MKNLTILALAGLLIACVSMNGGAVAQTVQECMGRRCVVSISVVNDEIKIAHDQLNVYDPEVIIQFHLTPNGYKFLSDTAKAIEFKVKSKADAAEHFSQPFVGGPRRLIMFDFNSLHDDAEFNYTIRVVDPDGKELTPLDPMIRNR